MKQKALKLDKDGNLKLSEQDVTGRIIGFLEAERWDCLRTPATKVRYPSGGWGWIFEEGHPDYICTRPVGGGYAAAALVQLFYLELKRPDASTHKRRLDKQREFTEAKTRAGYLCYRAPDQEHEQFDLFKEWYEELFR